MELTRNLEWLIDHWDQPDEGIWETRGGRRDYTYSRLMSWVAVERAIRIARHRSLPADLPRWTAIRDRIYNQIMKRGWSPDRRAFVQHHGTDVLDASLLLMPLCKFIAPTDPRWLSTLDAISAELVSDSLVYRYNVEASPDGLDGEEATFSLCSFWWVEALARAGRLDEARLAFEKMLSYSNHVGLYSEEIGPTGEQLGNFPQAFTHLALISAAYNLALQPDSTRGGGGEPETLEAVEKITVVLADDHELVRDGIRMVLEAEPDIEVVAEAADADAAARYVLGHKPTILVLDLTMPGRPSLELMPEIARVLPDTLRDRGDDAERTGVRKTGAPGRCKGFVVKQAAAAELVSAVRTVLAGETYINPSLGARMAAHPTSPPVRPTI